MDPPQSRLEIVEIVEWIEFWLELLRREPASGSTVLPFVQADLRRLKALLRSWDAAEPPSKAMQVAARRSLRLVGEMAFEFMKRCVNGDICGYGFRRYPAAA